MPTILTVRGMRIVIYLNDHGPAHVHVYSAGCEAIYELACPIGPPFIREIMAFRTNHWQSYSMR